MVQQLISALCFINKSSNSVRMFSKEVLASQPHRSFTSCSWDSVPGIGAISSGFVRFIFSQCESPSSVGSVEDKNSNSDEDVNCDSVLNFLISINDFKNKINTTFIDLCFGLRVIQLLENNPVHQRYGYHSAQVGNSTDASGLASEGHYADKDVACLTDSGNAVL